jgi:hypothetical protein
VCWVDEARVEGSVVSARGPYPGAARPGKSKSQSSLTMKVGSLPSLISVY